MLTATYPNPMTNNHLADESATTISVRARSLAPKPQRPPTAVRMRSETERFLSRATRAPINARRAYERLVRQMHGGNRAMA